MSKFEKQIVVSYKAFNKDFKCNNFQYEVGRTYEHYGQIRICNSGFHACHESAIDVLDYYLLVIIYWLMIMEI